MRLCYLLLLSSSAFVDITPPSAAASDSAIDHPAHGYDFGELRNSDPIRRSLRSMAAPESEERMMGREEGTPAQLKETLGLVGKVAKTVGFDGVEAKIMPDLKRVQQMERMRKMVYELSEESSTNTKRLHDRGFDDFETHVESPKRNNRHVTARDPSTRENGQMVAPSNYDDRTAKAIITKSLSAKTEEEEADAEHELDQLIGHWKKTNKRLENVFPLLDTVQDVDFFSPTIRKLLQLFDEGPSTSTADTDSFNKALFDHCKNDVDRFRRALAGALKKKDVDEFSILKSMAWLTRRLKLKDEANRSWKLETLLQDGGGYKDTHRRRSVDIETGVEEVLAALMKKTDHTSNVAFLDNGKRASL